MFGNDARAIWSSTVAGVTPNDPAAAAGKPLEVVELSNRHPWPGGLYLLAIELHQDGVALRVYASRPTPSAELCRRLRLRDNTPTEFACDPLEPEVVDGRAVLFFTPAPTDGLKWVRIDDTNGGRALLPYN